MRIAFVSEHASPLATLGGVDAGGQNLHVGELAVTLARAGHDVRVYTRRDAPELPEVVEYRDGVLVEHVPAGPAMVIPKDDLLPYMGQFGHWLAQRWRQGDWSPDVGHAHFWMSGLAALTAVAGTNLPLVVTYHALGTVKRRYQGERDTSPRQRIALERQLGRVADRVIAQSTDEVFELVQLGVPRTAISVVPSGVDLTMFTPHGPAAPRSERPRILSVGRLVARKGFAELISVLRLVPDAELVIIGGPPAAQLDADPEARRLRRIAARVQVADRVRLVGGVARDQLPLWYRSADVVACTPWYEPFGITPLEAMACGVPVVATAVGGLTDTIIDGVTGILVPPGDPRALAAALRRILSDELLRLSYSSGGNDRVRARYSWERAGADLLRIYRSLCGERTGSSRSVARPQEARR